MSGMVQTCSGRREEAGRPWRSLASLVTSAATIFVASSAGAAAPTAYEQIVAPILRARCLECHGEKKQKGKLALHTWAAFAKGGEAGPVFVAGKPADSEMLTRLRLPLAEEEHMPPHDEPQPAATEIALLERWIAAGASPTASLDDLRLSPELIAAIAKIPAARPSSRATELELAPAEVEKLRAPLAAAVAALQKKFPGALAYESRASAALHFTAAGLGREFGDVDLAALLPLREQLVRLDVAGTAITDQSADTLAHFTQLRVLRAGFTALGDSALAALAPLRALESCSVNHTAITDGGLAALKKLPALRDVRLTGTGVSREAIRESGLPVVESAAPEPVTR